MKFKAIIASVAALAVTAALPALEWPEVVKKHSQAVCKIEIMSSGQQVSSGSGFILDQAGKILTTAHVVAAASNNPAVTIEVSFPQSATPDKKYKADIETLSDAIDLAVIDVKTPLSPALALRSGEIPPLMTEILVLGFPLGQSLKSTPGNIQAMQTVPGLGSMMDLSAAVDPGNSGGPVLDKDGRVVGVVTAKLFGFNFNLALPFDRVNGFLANAASPTEVLITSVPDGGRVYRDGTYAGTAPLKLKMYGYDQKVTVESDGYEPLEKTVAANTAAGSAVEFALVAAKRAKVSVTIASDPDGATIWVNNTEIGKAPATYEAEKGERVRIRAALKGYKDASLVETAGDQDVKEIRIVLEKKRFGF